MARQCTSERLDQRADLGRESSQRKSERLCIVQVEPSHNYLSIKGDATFFPIFCHNSLAKNVASVNQPTDGLRVRKISDLTNTYRARRRGPGTRPARAFPRR